MPTAYTRTRVRRKPVPRETRVPTAMPAPDRTRLERCVGAWGPVVCAVPAWRAAGAGAPGVCAVPAWRAPFPGPAGPRVPPGGPGGEGGPGAPGGRVGVGVKV